MREVYLAYPTDGLSIGFAVFAAKPVIYLSRSRGMRAVFSEINAVCCLRFFRYCLVAILYGQASLFNILSPHRIYNSPFISVIAGEREREGGRFECNKIIR